MTDNGPNNDQPYHERPWGRAIGILLMLPIGLIAVLLLILVFGGRGSFGNGWLIIVIAIFFVLLVARMSFRRSRRRHWTQQRQGRNGPMNILRERYARGEISKEQFDQMSRDIHERRFRE
jgi:putative membrane protein